MYWVSENLGPKPSFLNIFPKVLQKWTQCTLFTIFWYPWPHMQKFSFCSQGAPGGPRTLKKFLSRVCKKIFLIKAKKNVVLGVPNFTTKIFICEYISKNSFRNELNAPFLHYFDTHDLTCKNFHFVRRGPRGSQNPKKKFMISKNYFN